MVQSSNVREMPMRIQSWMIVLFSVVCLRGVSLEARADDPGQAAVPSVVGTWAGKFKLIHSTGPAEQSLELRVLEQDGPLIKGEKAWQIAPGGTPGNVGGEDRTQATESLVGVIGFDGAIYLAEQGDSGIYTGRMTGPDTIEVVYIEAGDLATAYRAVLKRAK
jgi:hypothetical protein